MPPARYYIDCNCLSYCQVPNLPGWTPAAGAAIRRNLFGTLNRDELVVIGSQFHLEEASRIREHRAEWVRFFWDVVKWNLLLATTELVALEAKHGRPLQGNEPYDEYRRRQRMRDKSFAGRSSTPWRLRLPSSPQILATSTKTYATTPS